MFSRNYLFIAFLFFSLITNASSMDLEKPLGFEFGSSKKDVEKEIESSSKIIINNEKQTKEIDRLIVDGSFVQTPVTNATHYETRYDFFRNDLMSSSLHFDFDSSTDLSSAQKQYEDLLVGSFGDPESTEKMLSYRLIMWKIDNTKILLSSNDSRKTLKLEFLYEPIMANKIEREIDKKVYGEFDDPGERTFIEGDYSRPTTGPQSKPGGRIN